MERSLRPGQFLSPEEKTAVEAAIESAERETSGEVRVVVSRKVRGDAMDGAARVFHRLKMQETRERNGVLILLATKSRSYAILGDEGVHRAMGQGGWDHIRDGMAERFRDGRFGDGLVYAVGEVGKVLREHFPPREDDRDELPDEVVEE